MGTRRPITVRRKAKHALPTARRPSMKAHVDLRNSGRQDAGHRLVASESSSVRATSTIRPRWSVGVYTRASVHPVTYLLPAHEHVGQRIARIFSTPAFGVAVAFYVVSAWGVIGALTSHAPRVRPTTTDHLVAVSNATPPEAPTSVSPAPKTDASEVDSRTDQIDPKFFVGLQKVVDGLDDQSGPNGQQATGESMPPAISPDEPAQDPTTTAVPTVAPPIEAVVVPGGEVPDASLPTPSIP